MIAPSDGYSCVLSLCLRDLSLDQQFQIGIDLFARSSSALSLMQQIAPEADEARP